MAERIVIHPVTRIEGHAKISIYLDDSGEVESAQFHVTEFRGFEKICEGRPFHEMPGLMSRVCGICPVSHVLASCKAGDALLGVEVPRAGRAAAPPGELRAVAAIPRPELLPPLVARPAARHGFPARETQSLRPASNTISSSRAAASACASSGSASSNWSAASAFTRLGRSRRRAHGHERGRARRDPRLDSRSPRVHATWRSAA